MQRQAIILAIVLAACTSDDTSSDDTSTSSCSSMAGQDTCSADTICVRDECVAAFPRTYHITNLQLSVSTTNPTGTSWDAANGLPDLFVIVSVNAAMTGKTSTVQDSLTAAWPGPFSVQLAAGNTLTLQSFDEDIASNDLAYTCAATPIDAATLRPRAIGCQTSSWSMTMNINPL